jgi:hypothetical protein
MDWQQTVSLLIVSLTAGLMLRGVFRKRVFNFQSGGHCPGCVTSGVTGTRSSIILRARKGERPSVTVKMRSRS